MTIEFPAACVFTWVYCIVNTTDRYGEGVVVYLYICVSPYMHLVRSIKVCLHSRVLIAYLVWSVMVCSDSVTPHVNDV